MLSSCFYKLATVNAHIPNETKKKKTSIALQKTKTSQLSPYNLDFVRFHLGIDNLEFDPYPSQSDQRKGKSPQFPTIPRACTPPPPTPPLKGIFPLSFLDARSGANPKSLPPTLSPFPLPACTTKNGLGNSGSPPRQRD